MNQLYRLPYLPLQRGKLRHRAGNPHQVPWQGEAPPKTGIRRIGPGHILIKVTQRLAGVGCGISKHPLYPERAGSGRRQAEGKEEAKQETWGKRKRRGKSEIENRHTSPPSRPALPPFSQQSQSQATLQPFPPSGGAGRPAVGGVSSWSCQRLAAVPARPVWDPGSLCEQLGAREEHKTERARPLCPALPAVPSNTASQTRAAPPSSPAPPKGCFGSEATPRPSSPRLPPFS